MTSSGLHLALMDLITKLDGVSSGKTHEIIYSTIILCFESVTKPNCISLLLGSQPNLSLISYVRQKFKIEKKKAMNSRLSLFTTDGS